MPENTPPVPEEQSQALTPATSSGFDPFQLLPDLVNHSVTPEVKQRAELAQQMLVVLGPAGGAVTLCPGNQIDIAEHRKCPLASKCELLRANQAPQGQLCPLERNFVANKFVNWGQELNKTPDTLTETERVTVSELTWLDLQELRCATILSHPNAARMTQKNVKEVHPETGEHLSWEWVIHVNADLLDRIQTQRRMILKDWELTPEQKTKKARLEGRSNGQDLSSLQSAKADRLRRLGSGPVIEVT